MYLVRFKNQRILDILTNSLSVKVLFIRQKSKRLRVEIGYRHLLVASQTTKHILIYISQYYLSSARLQILNSSIATRIVQLSILSCVTTSKESLKPMEHFFREGDWLTDWLQQSQLRSVLFTRKSSNRSLLANINQLPPSLLSPLKFSQIPPFYFYPNSSTIM